MNIKDAILKRHSVRSFLKQDVPLEYIMDIIDTAKYAPSCPVWRRCISRCARELGRESGPDRPPPDRSRRR